MNEELKKAVAALRNPWLITENRASVVVYRDDLTAVLDRLEELEEQFAGLPDTESKLMRGDEVETLIDYRTTPKGSHGVVEAILSSGDDGAEYPYRIRFEGEKYTIGYNRYELRKVPDVA